MRILVIGKNGYVSTCFQTYMKKYQDIEVVAITARNGAWKDADFHNYDAVFNATGLAHNDARKGTEEEFIALNVTLPIQLAEKAKSEGVSVFIHMSSMIVYGDMSPIAPYTFITESTVPKPENIYGRSKLLGEEGIMKLNSDSFHIAVIRSSLVYGENAVDNFKKLTEYAVTFPLFPDIINYRSMIYADNLCELVRLIAENRGEGIYYPQQEQYICTSQLLHDIGMAAGHKVRLTKVFNPLLRMMSAYIPIVRKVFGSEAYEMGISNHFDAAYRVVDYSESVRRIAAAKRQ